MFFSDVSYSELNSADLSLVTSLCSQLKELHVLKVRIPVSPLLLLSSPLSSLPLSSLLIFCHFSLIINIPFWLEWQCSSDARFNFHWNVPEIWQKIGNSQCQSHTHWNPEANERVCKRNEKKVGKQWQKDEESYSRAIISWNITILCEM